MQDIKIPDSHSKKNDFEVKHVAAAEVRVPAEPSEKVRVNFEKFVQLVATHDFEEVMRKHAKEDIVLSTNLLTDLANAHDDKEEDTGKKKIPIFFIVGIILGVIITYWVIRS